MSETENTEESKMVFVEFQHCGLNSDDSAIGHEIAMSAETAEEAWAEVDKLDEATRENIYGKGNFLEQITDGTMEAIKKTAGNGDAIAWSNDSDAEVDESTGDVWYNGHWATAEELQRFAEWIDRK